MKIDKFFSKIILIIKNRIFYKIQNTFSKEENERLLTVEYLDGTNKKIIRRFYPDGGIKSESIFENDKLNGICVFYYQNGNIKSKENYVNDLREGVTILYTEDGKKYCEEYYIRGRLVSKNIFS